MRKLLDSLENAQKAWVDLKKDAKGAHKLFKDYQPEEDLVKREKIIYTGSVKDFVRLTLPILNDPRFRVNGQTNRCAQWLISDPQALRGNWRSLLPGAKELPEHPLDGAGGIRESA